MYESPYVFRASETSFSEGSSNLKVKEARMLNGMTLRYQERQPGPRNDGPWCQTGHSVFVVSGRVLYEFHNHVVELGPGDMAHIPSGAEHAHRPSVAGQEPACYFLTEFGD